MIEHVFARCEFVPEGHSNRLSMWSCTSMPGKGYIMYLHILHRIRLLGMMTGVPGTESEGVCGYLANMSPGGGEPSPS